MGVAPTFVHKLFCRTNEWPLEFRIGSLDKRKQTRKFYDNWQKGKY